MKHLSVVALFGSILMVSCGKVDPNCTDGLLNQNETDIDCGGVCAVCKTCDDGIQNQGEARIDCGGPCTLCPAEYTTAESYGGNLIHPDSTGPGSVVGVLLTFSIAATLPEGTTLKVIMTNTSTLPQNNYWVTLTPDYPGWSMGAYNGNTLTQELSAAGEKDCLAGVYFRGSGSLLFEIFENGEETPGRSFTHSW